MMNEDQLETNTNEKDPIVDPDTPDVPAPDDPYPVVDPPVEPDPKQPPEPPEPIPQYPPDVIF